MQDDSEFAGERDLGAFGPCLAATRMAQALSGNQR
jgi:hypothetical protein